MFDAVANGDMAADVNQDGLLNELDVTTALSELGVVTSVIAIGDPGGDLSQDFDLEICEDYLDDEIDPWDLCAQSQFSTQYSDISTQADGSVVYTLMSGVSFRLNDCIDPRVQQAMNDPRLQGIIESVQAQCGILGNPNAQEVWITCLNNCSTDDHTTNPELPPHVRLCMGMFISGTLGYDDILETLMHELTHVRQLCQDPDNFYVGTNNKICAEIEGYCSMPRNQQKCQTAAGRCDLACLSVMHSYCFGNKYARCVKRCKKIESGCHRGFHSE